MNQQEVYKQLGMSSGTATYRLARLLLFHYVQQASADKCFRCGLKIESIDDFSVEHKKPWLHVSPDLYWDLGNIAFSHRTCNSGAARQMNKSKPHQRLVGPVGTSWCTEHKEFLPEENFHKNAAIWNGLQRQCIDCRQKRNKIADVVQR
jgi:hypothetical protein